jgi:FixJ family two-component response regulator
MSGSPHYYVAVVDDDDSLCRSVGRLLRTAGIQSVTYASAEAFLADAKRPRFDCLVLDIQLAGMSGIELQQQLRAGGSTTPVVFNTAHDETDLRERALESGCAAYLLKTASGDALLTAVRNVIRPSPPAKTDQF